MSLSTSSTREPFLSTIIEISSLMFILFNTLIDKLSWFFSLLRKLGILSQYQDTMDNSILNTAKI